MKAKISRGNGFLGTLSYVLDEGKKRTGDKKAVIVAGNMSANRAKDLSREFGFTRSLRRNVKNPVWHCSLALPKGEKIGDGVWDRLSNRFLEEMKVDVDNHQFVVVKHGDTANDHVHIVMCRVGLDSQIWHGRKDVFKAIKATQKLEKEFNLTLTSGYLELDQNGKEIKRKAPKKAPKFEEVQMSARTNEAPTRLILQQILDEALKEKTDIFSFIEQLECANVTVRPNVASSGRLNGFSFEYQGVAFKGSDLGDDYKWSNQSKLKQNVIYDQVRHSEKLIATAERIKQRANQQGATVAKTENPKQQNAPTSARANSAGHDSVNRGIKKEHTSAVGSAECNNEHQQRDTTNNDKRNEHTALNNAKSLQGIGASSTDARSNATLDKLQNQVNDIRQRTDHWSDLGNSISDLAAPTHASNHPPADQVKKVEAWRNQHKILGAEKYRLTLVPRQDPDKKVWVIGNKTGQKERFYSAQEVESLIPFLRRKNAQNYDIYITPVDPRFHYIVVDDLTTAKQAEMTRIGYKPTLIQESSENNRQAIFKLEKQEVGTEAAILAANALVVELNKNYGDPKFSGAVHAFRMSGFSNKKVGRKNAFTRIIATCATLCEVATKLLKNKVEFFKNKKDQVAVEARLKGMDNDAQFSKDPASRFKREWKKIHGLAVSKNWEIDYSRIDFHAAKLALAGGVKVKDLEQAIIQHSPSVLERKNNVEDYAQRTVAKALAEVQQPTLAPTAAPKPPTPFDPPKLRPKM